MTDFTNIKQPLCHSFVHLTVPVGAGHLTNDDGTPTLDMGLSRKITIAVLIRSTGQVAGWVPHHADNEGFLGGTEVDAITRWLATTRGREALMVNIDRPLYV